MKEKNRSSFAGVEKNTPKQFNQLIKNPNTAKKVKIAGDENFSNNTLTEGFLNGSQKKQSQSALKEEVIQQTNIVKRGRPVVVKDKRYKVCKPKMISPALESKLNCLQDYVEEFRDVEGRITFEKYIDTLVESYIKTKLSISKEEHLRDEIKEKFEKL